VFLRSRLAQLRVPNTLPRQCRFYFHGCNGNGFVEHDEGQELPVSDQSPAAGSLATGVGPRSRVPHTGGSRRPARHKGGVGRLYLGSTFRLVP
jgi:hypothetical protein